jgi:hypothetical protein
VKIKVVFVTADLSKLLLSKNTLYLKIKMLMLLASKNWGWNKNLDVNEIDGYAPYTPFPFSKEGK